MPAKKSPRATYLTIRLSEDELAALTQSAADAKETISDYARKAIEARRKGIRPVFPLIGWSPFVQTDHVSQWTAGPECGSLRIG